MAVIHDLISKIEDVALRERITNEVDKLTKLKKFGLVFEEHIPECTPLYDIPIKLGANVAVKTGYVNDIYTVVEIKEDSIICRHKETHEQKTFSKDEVVVVAEFGEPIYPYLKPFDSICNAPDSDLWHTLIEADNYHALQLLEYLYAGKVDCIYIDPPYNTGAKDWKYNNDYVDSADAYRHSKWLSFMEKRLEVAKKLLNPKDSVLIVAIDEKEYLHLGCLLEQIFPDAMVQMVIDVINPRGTNRENEFSRVEEYLFICRFGNCSIIKTEDNMLGNTAEARKARIWDAFNRGNNLRESGNNQFFPIYIDEREKKIIKIGESMSPNTKIEDFPKYEGLTPVFPINKKGRESIWRAIPKTTREWVDKGYVKVSKYDKELNRWTLSYIPSGFQKKIESGQIIVTNKNADGSLDIERIDSSIKMVSPKTVWNTKYHNATEYGATLMKSIILEHQFSYPKSLYSVKDTLRFFVANKPNAIIVDFFAGSGTTLHAVNLLNSEDGGHRRCILVTNNEVSDDEAKKLKAQGYKPGDKEWESLGIAQYVTWPRTVCSIKGVDVLGKSLNGEYLTYETQEKIIKRNIRQLSFTIDEHDNLKCKKQLVSLVGKSQIPLSIVKEGCNYIVTNDSNVTILFNDQYVKNWVNDIDGREALTDIYIVTTNNKLFERVKKEIEELLGDYTIQVPKTMQMSDGFKANATYFKLGFLDKTNVALGRQFRELLPILWMKAGAIGACPTLSERVAPSMLILSENSFAVLTDESEYLKFKMDMGKHPEIKTIYFVTDSESAYKAMARDFTGVTTYQLYKDYLTNFRINYRR